MALPAHAMLLPIVLGIAPGGCGPGCVETNCGGTIDLLNACKAGLGCDVDGQPIECSPKTGYVNSAVGYCQIEAIGAGQTLTIDLAGFDLGRRNDVAFHHGAGLRFEDGVDFEGARAEIEGVDIQCTGSTHGVALQRSSSGSHEAAAAKRAPEPTLRHGRFALSIRRSDRPRVPSLARLERPLPACA